MILLLGLLGFALSWGGTAWMRRYALSSALLDHPNERSAHTVPTPRGGGVGMVIAFLGLLGLCWVQGLVEAHLAGALMAGASLVAGVGFLDDRFHLSSRLRLICHAVAALCCLWGLAQWGLSWSKLAPPEGVLWALAFVYLVWMVNLCNFMDGIDGIASVEAVTVCAAGSVAAWLVAPGSAWWMPLLFAACVAGFLVWNFPPAKIFMGDAGSGFMGLVLGFLSLWACGVEPLLLPVWLILMGCFITDTTFTLCRRVWRGERFDEAHRLHAYQYAARRYSSHLRVTLATGIVNLGWLFPLAIGVSCQKLSPLLGLLLAYGPLLFLAWMFKAGHRQAQAGR